MSKIQIKKENVVYTIEESDFSQYEKKGFKKYKDGKIIEKNSKASELESKITNLEAEKEAIILDTSTKLDEMGKVVKKAEDDLALANKTITELNKKLPKDAK